MPGWNQAESPRSGIDHRTPRWQEIDSSEYAAFIANTPGCVIGGTAWDFANPIGFPGSLDLLVIDEAGQFCLANTIAVAPAAANLLLLGDPQQLPQVSQGTHPEPVDTSALEWLVDGQRTLPDERGYFLDRSYRMHPAVCAAVSRAVLRGQAAFPRRRTAARHLDGYPPGVQVLRRSSTKATRPKAPRRPTRSSPRSSDCSAPRGPTSTAPGRWPPPTCWCWRPTTPRWRCCAGG